MAKKKSTLGFMIQLSKILLFYIYRIKQTISRRHSCDWCEPNVNRITIASSEVGLTD